MDTYSNDVMNWSWEEGVAEEKKELTNPAC